jgi:hypothetical protein
MLNRRIVNWLAVMMTLSALTACVVIENTDSGRGIIRGTGEVVDESRNLSGFNQIELATIGTLIIESGDETGVVIEAQENLIQYIETVVRGGRLVIDVQEGVNIDATRPIRYRLTVGELHEIALSSSGSAQATRMEATDFSISISSSGSLEMDGIEADQVEIAVSSSGNVRLSELVADRLNVEIQSSGNITIGDGRADTQDISISSSGSYDARNLRSGRADARLSSSGDATVRVSEVLNARLTSSGDLFYIGNPQVDADATSSGKVEQIDD